MDIFVEKRSSCNKAECGFIYGDDAAAKHKMVLHSWPKHQEGRALKIAERKAHVKLNIEAKVEGNNAVCR